MSVFRIADLEIEDVQVTVVFGGEQTAWGREAAESLFPRLAQMLLHDSTASELVFVWQDQLAGVHFLASPQLHLFFERVNFDQLAAQTTREIVLR